MTLSIGDFIGFANVSYGKNGVLPDLNTLVKINGVDYRVIASVGGASNPSPTSFQGLILFDQLSNTVIVADRGSQEPTDFGVDAAMAVADVNLQWSDAGDSEGADSLARDAANFAASVGATVYAVGHSLGGTLAQLQAANMALMLLHSTLMVVPRLPQG